MTALPSRPDAEEAHAARLALPRVRGYLEDHQEHVAEVPVVVEGGGEPLVLPRAALELLTSALAHMAAGRGVTIVPRHTELTTHQAAGILNVSRPHLVGLLDAGEIEFRLVGTHRRVRMDSLLDYLRRDDQRRREVGDELSVLGQELGLD
ncbi:helix-turn-helix domain-containing protein [Spiractinospora alimapuensis]|uniref:helix-turn-helix domain-containing protein n=1 Tax=Spiractinospora alimapuensis TaxID=2820884 RepID=UPI001F466A4D|nr:helix-turn-helix domain-containing protein [Spiractinospora alimapuensis]QVQ50999.1 helix-turn-helix domain-containing protein [Spiractinospora alimapuensis]